MESTRIEMQREGLDLEVSKIYESMGEMRAGREGSNFPTPPPRPQSPIYLSLEGSRIGSVKDEHVPGEPVRRRGSRLVSLQEGLRRLSSRADMFRGRIRTASCADEVDDDEVFLCSIVHENDWCTVISKSTFQISKLLKSDCKRPHQTIDIETQAFRNRWSSFFLLNFIQNFIASFRQPFPTLKVVFGEVTS